MHLNKIEIKRRNDLIDYFSKYHLIVNDKNYKIKSGETKYIELNNGNNIITVKHLYFSKSIEINSTSEKSLIIRTFLNRNWFLFFISTFILTFIFMSFNESKLDNLFSIVSYLAIGFLSILIYNCTIGFKNYLSIDFSN